MSDEAALLAAIREAPADDLPRLAYADWLDEPDQPDRATFIRLQCASARLPANSPERPDRERPWRELLRRHRAEWFGTLHEDFKGCDIERGLVTQLRGNAKAYLEH